MKLGLIAAALGMVAGTSAQAQVAQTAASDGGTAVAPVAVPPAKEKTVCRSELETGSVVRHRICHTKAQWAEIEAQAAQSQDLEWLRTNRNRTH